MFSEKSKTVLLAILSLSLLLVGSAYLMFLYFMFPRLVPFHGSGEGFTLGKYNNYSAQLPWSAYSRLHLTLHANDTVKLCRDGDYVCNCVQHDLVLERGDDMMLTMKSNSPVRGWFTARQEIPLTNQLLAFAVILTGLVCLSRSMARVRVHNP